LARAESRNKTLEEENAHMLNRWKVKVSEEARKMNEANEFYHQVQQMVKNPLSHSSTRTRPFESLSHPLQ
jgi:autophagy-related protein 16